MKRFFCFLLCLFPLLSLGCEKAEAEEISVTGFYFDTVVTIKAFCDESILKETLQSCAEYEKLLSKTIEGSDVWRINHAKGESVRLSKAALSIIATAKEVSKASNGAFDISIAPAAALWDFSAKQPSLPDMEKLKAAAALCDYTKISVNGDSVTLPENMQIDLGGIAKGYISGAIGRELIEKGVESALIDFGGNIFITGPKPDGSAWRIGIKDPFDAYGKPLCILERSGGAVISSGVYERCFTIGSQRYHHILDTRTGMPIQNGVEQFSIVADDPALADALSTACLALGAEEGLALAESFGAYGYCFMEDGGVYKSEALTALEE